MPYQPWIIKEIVWWLQKFLEKNGRITFNELANNNFSKIKKKKMASNK